LVPGELFIGGEGLARGYLNRPALTAASFIPNPFSDRVGARLYKTGDVVRYLAGGELEFIGRGDDQVKVRGYRIEMGEIEAWLRKEESVKEAVVVAREYEAGGKRVIGYVVEDEEKAVGGAKLRKGLKERVPEYMVPSAIVVLEKMPLSANGKVDRKALPDPEEMREEGGEEEARSEVEELMAGIWEEVLKVERVGVGANFFEMGGHSLLATQVMSRVREVFGVEVELRKLFEKPTVRGLVESVEEKLGIGRGEKEEGIKRREKEGRVPLSYAQERLWFLEQLEPGSGAYNIPAAIRLRGELNVEALKGSVGRVVERHEALRTVFIEEGGKVRQEVKAEGSVRIEEVDLRSVREEEREEEVKRIGKEEGLKGFDLREGPVLRMKLLRVGEEEHVLVIVLHHIVSDGWSMG